VGVDAPEALGAEEDDLDGEEVPDIAASGGTSDKAPVAPRRPTGGGGARRRTKPGD
jgi:hypothetical protein